MDFAKYSRKGSSALSLNLLYCRPVLQNQYIEVNSPIPGIDTLFGLGEHISTTGLALRRDGAPLTLWTRDCAGADPDQNTYGAWPMLVDVRPGLPFQHPCFDKFEILKS